MLFPMFLLFAEEKITRHKTVITVNNNRAMRSQCYNIDEN